MGSAAINLVLLDSKSVMAGPLSSYLNNRFGKRVNISTYYDADKCMRSIDEKSHVVILNYYFDANEKERDSKASLNIFNTIKKVNPSGDVTMITSGGNLENVTKELQRGTCEYIMQREQYLHDLIHLINTRLLTPVKTLVVLPLQNLITLPVRKAINLYSLKEYVALFVIAFISVGILVLVGFLSADFFRK